MTVSVTVQSTQVTVTENETGITVTPETTNVTVVEGIPIGGGSDAYYRHIQSTAQSTWVISHNLGKRVSVSVVDSAGDSVYGNIHYDSDNQVTLSFSAAFSGEAYCN